MTHRPIDATIESLTADCAELSAAEDVLRRCSDYEICGLVRRARMKLNEHLGALWIERAEEQDLQLTLAPRTTYEEQNVPF